jgi:photosystem II stability/assembly factor-like uncharacterized protein
MGIPVRRSFVRASEAVVIILALSLFTLIFCAWVLFSPLDPHETAAAARLFYLVLALCGLVGVLAVYRARFRNASSARWRPGFVLVLALFALSAGVAVYHYRWNIRLASVRRADDLPIDTSGYEVEKLPFPFHVSFAQGSTVYFADPPGNVYRAEDSNPVETLMLVGRSGLVPRSLVVSSRGSIFISGDRQPLLRSGDAGRTWVKVLDMPVWRMAEDQATGTLYAGNYSKGPGVHAVVVKSNDDGRTWRQVFADKSLDHIHTLRFDPEFHRLYIAAGDGRRRGEAYSDDAGSHWQWILRGIKQGYTDAAVTSSSIVWGSDDRLGRLVIAARNSPLSGETVLWSKGQQIWFVSAQGTQVFAGTYIEDTSNRGAVYLLASNDEGRTWQKLLEYGGSHPGPKGFATDSRQLSAGGWLYFTAVNGQGYRVRRSPGR